MTEKKEIENLTFKNFCQTYFKGESIQFSRGKEPRPDFEFLHGGICVGCEMTIIDSGHMNHPSLVSIEISRQYELTVRKVRDMAKDLCFPGWHVDVLFVKEVFQGSFSRDKKARDIIECIRQKINCEIALERGEFRDVDPELAVSAACVSCTRMPSAQKLKIGWGAQIFYTVLTAEDIIPSVERKNKKLENYISSNYDQLWLLLVLEEDIISSSLELIDVPILPKNVVSGWDRIILFGRVYNRIMEIHRKMA